MWREDGAQVVELGGRRSARPWATSSTLDAILADQDAAGIDASCCRPWVPLARRVARGARALPDPERRPRRAARRDPAVSVLGAVPLQDPESRPTSCAALMAGRVRGRRDRGARATAILGDDRFAPFWAAAEETGALVFVHPTTRGFDGPARALPVEHGRQPDRDDGHRRAPRAWPACSSAIRTCGCCSPTAAARCSRCAAGCATRTSDPAAGAVALREPVEDSLRRFYYDTITHDPALLRALVDVRRRRPRAARLRPPVRHGRPRPGRDRARRRPGAGGRAPRSSAATRSGCSD